MRRMLLAALALVVGGLWQGPDVIDPPVITPIEEMPPDPFGPGDGLPPPDTPFVFRGPGVTPTWEDVWHAAIGDLNSSNPLQGNTYADPGYVFTIKLAYATVGATIKALGGMIDRVGDTAATNINQTWDRLDNIITWMLQWMTGMQASVDSLVAQANYVAHLVVPDLQAQIDTLKVDIPYEIKYVAALERQWVIDHVFAPLYAELLKVSPEIDTKIAANNVTQRAQTSTDIATAVAPVAAAIATLTPILTALQTESEQCTQPICQTMGPKTSLGNLLKGLAAALEAGALLELANAHESDIADAIRRIGAKGLDVFYALDRDFIQGGDNLATTVADELKNLI